MSGSAIRIGRAVPATVFALAAAIALLVSPVTGDQARAATTTGAEVGHTTHHGYWLVGRDGGSSPSDQPSSTARRGTSISNARWWASRPPGTTGATGWSPPTEGSSPSVTPGSMARSRGSASLQRDRPSAQIERSGRRDRPVGRRSAATSWWRPTAGCSPSGMHDSKDRAPASGVAAVAAVAVMPDATGDGYWLVTTIGPRPHLR